MAQVIIPAGAQVVPAVADNDSVLSKEGAQTLIGASTDLSALLTGVSNFTIISSISTTPSQPFHMAVTGAYRNASKGGTIHVRPKGAGANDINRAIHSGVGATHFVTGGTVDGLDVLDGVVRIDDAVLLNSLVVTGGNVVQGYNATENTSWKVLGGSVNTERGLGGDGLIDKGATVFVKRKNTTNAPPVQDTGSLVVLGSLHWHGGNLASLEIYGDGTVDMSGVDQDITVTALIATAEARQRSVLQSRNPDVTITITSETIIGGLAEADGKRAVMARA